MLQTLINKQGSFEIVRDQIYTILKDEITNQVQLATDDGQPDPNKWNLDIYKERFKPWGKFLNPTPGEDLRPIVNVWFSGADVDRAGSNVVELQKFNGNFNIDVYGYGLSSDNQAGGHNPSDLIAVANLQFAITLVYNIIMAASNIYLLLPNIVTERMFNSITDLQPREDDIAVQNIVAARMSLLVKYQESTPQYEPVVLEGVDITGKNASTDDTLWEQQINYN